MKTRSGIILLIYLSIGLTTTFAYENTYDGISQRFLYKMISDTAVANRFIEIEPFNLTILPPSSGVKFYKDGIVFLSSTRSDRKMLTDHISFGKIDTRYAVLKDSVLEAPLIFSPSSSFPYPSEAITFSNDCNTMYFTNYSKADGCEKIYQAKYSEGDRGKWSMDSYPVSFCTDQSIYTHPALSADGKLMIFASNRPGSIGGMDLFVSLEKKGTWSDPVNLGDAVNSTSNELYPFLDSENNLFFSSDNIQGYGGYDIYVCKFKSNTWEKPINLSRPVNTRFDDIAFTIDRKGGKSAFYSVKQNTGLRTIKLYRVTMTTNSPDSLLTLSQFYTRPDISQMVILALEPAVQATDRITENALPKTSQSRGENDVLIYRVQFLTSFNPKTRSQITVSGKDYSVFEYLYSGAYRLCVGNFSTLSPAIELQNLLMKNDYPQAFVVVFKNNVMSLDPSLLKEQSESGSIGAVEKTQIAKTQPVKPAQVESTAQKYKVVYRVQIITNKTAKSSYKITINNKIYNTFEYLYGGGYRTCVGEFSTLNQAIEFQTTCRRYGYPQAFVVAFKNNVRSTDPVLFK